MSALTPEQEVEAQVLADTLTRAVAADFLTLARLLVSKFTHQVFGQTEFDVRDRVHRLGAKALELYLAEKNGYEGSSVTCPQCQYAAPFHGYRRRR